MGIKWRQFRQVVRETARATHHLHDVRRILIEEHLRDGVAAVRNPLTEGAVGHWSQSNEDGIIERIMERVISPTRTGTFLEFGVGDGTENNTIALLARGWRGEWFGGERLLSMPERSKRLRFERVWIDAKNIVNLAMAALSRVECSPEELDLLSLDLDGNDYWLTEVLLRAGVRPRLWVAEYNARFPVGAEWVMPYDAKHRWQRDDYYGASLSSIAGLMGSYGYFPVACSSNGANAFFVRTYARSLFQDVPGDLRAIYQPPRYFSTSPKSHPVSARTLSSLFED